MFGSWYYFLQEWNIKTATCFCSHSDYNQCNTDICRKCKQDGFELGLLNFSE